MSKTNTAPRSPNFTRAEINKTMPQGKARDDLDFAYGGKENKGPSKDQKTSGKSTNVKARKTEKSKTRTPVG